MATAAAIPLVTINESTGLFEVSPEALAYLRTLNGRVSTVAVAGAYRTGKSFLLNSLAGSQFAVGSTVKACTKGIWLYGKSVKVGDVAAAAGTPNAPGGDVNVLFLDTEGLGSTVRSETFDVRLFSLALLLSSVFAYNSVGVIDGASIARLGLVAQLTRYIHTKAQPVGRSEDSGVDFAQYMPAFLWILRDMTVRLEKEGRKISPKEYLEDALKPEDGLSDESEAKNQIRGMLRSFFPERDCVTLVRPVSDEAQLKALAQLPPDTLRPEFRTGLEALRKRVFALAAARPKTLYGRPLTGAMLAALTATYVDALNKGGAPVIASAWERVVDGQCAEAVEAGMAAYKAALRDAVGAAAAKQSSKKPVLEEAEVQAAHAAAEAAAFAAFTAAAVADADKTPAFEARLRDAAYAELSAFRASNEAASAALCGEVLEALQGQARAHLQRAAVAGSDGGEAAAAASARARAAAADSNGAASAATVDAAARAVSAAAKAVVPAGALARAYRAAADDLADQYAAAAKGPAKHRLLADFLVGRMPALLAEAAAAADEARGAHVAALTAWGGELGAALAAARGREAAAAEALACERRSGEAALADAARASAEAAERARSLLAARDAEVARLSDKYDRAVAAFEATSLRSDEAAKDATAQLAQARAKLEEVLSAKVEGLLQVATLSQRLADAEGAKADAQAALAEAEKRIAAEEKAAAVLVERVRTAENETVRLREATELLYESNSVSKSLVATEKARAEEAEYQLAMVKARVAQLEADKMSAQADATQMETLASVMKALLAKHGLAKKVALGGDKVLQRAFDSLPTEP